MAGLLGDPAMPEIDDYEAETTPDGIVARDIRVWQPNPDGTGRPAQVLYNYYVSAPLTASFHQGTRRAAIFHVVYGDSGGALRKPVLAGAGAELCARSGRRKSCAAFRIA